MASKLERAGVEFSYLTFNEYEIIQNAALGAHALYTFVDKYSNYNKDYRGVSIFLCFLVLPIVYTKDYSNVICSKNFSRGSFIKILTSNEIIFEGIQERVLDLKKTTFRALDIAFSAELLIYDKDNGKIYLNRKKNITPRFGSDKGYKKIIAASRRLGAWFSQLETEQILAYLNVKI